jgi:hypothetical protein
MRCEWPAPWSTSAVVLLAGGIVTLIASAVIIFNAFLILDGPFPASLSAALPFGLAQDYTNKDII